MKKLFTIAALFIFMISMTSFKPNEVGGAGKGTSTPTGQINSELNVGGVGKGTSTPTGQMDLELSVGGGVGKGTSTPVGQ